MPKRTFAQINAEPSSDGFDASFVERTSGLAQEPSQDVGSLQFFAPGNTQTQTQAYNLEPFSYSEFCQKENMQSPSQPKSQPPFITPASPSSPPLKDPAQALRPHYSVDRGTPVTEPKTPIKPPQSYSVVKTPESKASPMRSLSEDSFGGNPDPIQAVRLSDKFQMPLSQLGRTTEDEESGRVSRISRESTPLGPPPADFVRSSPFSSPRLNGRNLKTYLSAHSDPGEDMNGAPQEHPAQDAASQAMTSPSSSYGRYIDGKFDRDSSPTQELVATQTNQNSTRRSQNEMDAEGAFAQFGLSNMTSAYTDALTIRLYQQIAGESQLEEEATQPTGGGHAVGTQPNISRENSEEKTQPSFSPRDETPQLEEKTPRQYSTRDSQLPQEPTFPSAPLLVASPRPMLRRDMIDIVPDSESSQHDGQCSSPVPALLGKAKNTTSATRSTLKGANDKLSDADIVPDSTDVVGRSRESEDENDVAQSLAYKTPDKRVQEEEEEESDGSDIPLAKRPLRSRTTMGPPAAIKKKVGRTTRSEPRPRGRKTPDDLIPSSAPEQDKALSSKSRGKGRANIKGRERRSESVASNTTSRPHRVSVDRDELRKKYCETSDSEDALTEPDDLYDDDLMLGPSSSKKRKRAATNATAAGKIDSKNAKRTSKQTPARKRTRTITSRSSSAQATRVFALWKQNDCYYPGYIQSHDSGIYTVRFDDGFEGVARFEEMRAFDLRQGDQVEENDELATVAGVERLENKTISINTEHGTKEVNLSDICIPKEIILESWSDRMLEADTIVPAIRLIAPPLGLSPSKRSLSGSGKSTGIFNQFAFLLTKNGQKGKGEAGDIVSRHGGTIFDHWEDVLTLDGVYRSNQRNWHIEREDISCKLSSSPQHFTKLFCIATTPTLTVKYMMALALGVPCISADWIHDSIKKGKVANWSTYLLPQGLCRSLGVTASQRIDLNWGSNVRYLRQVWSNNPFKCSLFQDKSVLLIGSNFIPTRADHPHAQLRYVVACMGAQYVEATDNFATVTRKLSSFDFVVIHEKGDYQNYENGLRTVKQVVTVPWLKDSLVMGRPMPFEDF